MSHVDAVNAMIVGFGVLVTLAAGLLKHQAARVFVDNAEKGEVKGPVVPLWILVMQLVGLVITALGVISYCVGPVPKSH
jgi:hypothetical protein